MGEQNRRAVEVERRPGDAADKGGRQRPGFQARPVFRGKAREGLGERADERALGPLADERQTRRQAPAAAAPGESAEDDTIG